MGHLSPPRAVSVVVNVTEDGRVTASVVKGEVAPVTLDAAIKRAQAYYRQLGPEDVSIVDELIAERRLEALRE